MLSILVIGYFLLERNKDRLSELNHERGNIGTNQQQKILEVIIIHT